MKKIRLLLLLLALAGVSAFVAPARDGRPLLDFRRVRGEVARLAGSAPSARPGQGKRTVYKWKEDGTWHYSNVRPADHPEAEEVRAEVSWVEEGKGARASEGSTPGDGEPRSAGELLEQSRRLGEQTQARESELDRLTKEANQ